MKGLFHTFYPDRREKSAYGIDYAALYKQGVRGLIFDIDNTLVPHGAPATEEAISLFSYLRDTGFATCLISNNQLPRVKPFADAVGSAFLEDAHKPSKKGYLAACEKMGTEIRNTVFVGDQLFTDIWGAKRAGLSNILTDPIHPKEEIQIVFKRKLERIVLHFYEKAQKRQGKKEIEKEPGIR